MRIQIRGEEGRLMKRIALVICLGVMALTLDVSTEALAQRFVVVNGQVMGPQELTTLDRYACQYVPNGYYWLNTQTGLWGYAGNPAPQGYISDGCCRQTRRPSLSERRMLYSPYDWVR
jgi:hypothetical protein